MDDVTLKNCPFCGASGLAVTSGPCAWNEGGIAWNVMCHTRDCHGGIFSLGYDMFPSPEKAIAAWNQRADAQGEPVAAQDVAALVELLRDALEIVDDQLPGEFPAFCTDARTALAKHEMTPHD